jgi:membrane protein YdbS with pleckstrin-like domain
MLTENEKQFLRFWEENRLRQKSWKYQLLTGLPVGLLFSLPIIVLVLTAKLWYVRADMAAHTMLSPVVLIIAVLLIAVFIAFFYKNHRWEMREQLYRSLKAREEQENVAPDKP